MQCITAAFWLVNYAFKSDKFQDAAFIRSSVPDGVDVLSSKLVTECLITFSDCASRRWYLIICILPPLFLSKHWCWRLLLYLCIWNLFLVQRAASFEMTKAMTTIVFFEPISLTCPWAWTSWFFKDPSVWRSHALLEFQVFRQEIVWTIPCRSFGR